MKDFESLITARRSTRKFTKQQISPEKVQKILQSALLAPTSKNCKSWEFVAVENKQVLKQLSVCKDAGGAFLEGCALAVVVLGDKTTTDAWIEDASIAAIYMQLQAEDLGLGSCWCHVRNRFAGDTESEQYVRDLLEIPDRFGVLCIIGLGVRDQERKPNDLSKLTWEKVHIGKMETEEQFSIKN
ncbi:MAG: nitroreductase family protein [Tannerella sp.]|jgi:nitroreductase|nr:nitroreductase family protein [Tannerella sp.]